MPDEIQEVQDSNPLLEGQEDVSSEAIETPTETPEPVGDPASDPEPDRLEVFRNLGFENVEDPDDAQNRLIESYRQQGEQIQQMQRRQQELEALAQYGNQYLQQQQQPVQETGEPEGWWNPPQVDMNTVAQYRVADEHGNLVWKPETPPDVRAQADAHERYIEDWANKLVRNPQEVLPKIIQEEVDRRLETVLQEREQSQAEVRQIQQIQQEAAEWMYEKDPRTGQPAREMNGQYKMTPAGNAALHFLQEANQYGIVNPSAQWNYAMRSLQAMSQQQQQQPQRDPKQEHLEKFAQNAPNRTGSQETPEQPLERRQNPNQSLGQEVLALMQASGEA